MGELIMYEGSEYVKEREYAINLNGLSSGLYFIKLQTPLRTTFKRFSKAK